MVPMPEPVPSNLRSMMFSSAVLVIPQPAPEVVTTSYTTCPETPALAASAAASKVALNIEPMIDCRQAFIT